VQTAHAAALVGCEANLIVLKVKNERDLIAAYERFAILKPAAFIEPDLNNQMTSFALRATLEEKKLLSNFPTLKESDLQHTS